MTNTLLTIAEFEHLPEAEDQWYELDSGELLAMTFPTPRHNWIAATVYRILQEFAMKTSAGLVFPMGTGFIIDAESNTLRSPDVGFILGRRAGAINPNRNIPGPPDLAVEVVSPTETAASLRRKINQYCKAGCHTVWVIYPDAEQVDVLECAGTSRLLQRDDTITCPELLPGFSMLAGRFFD